jgi:hypothetical protein
LAPESIPGGFPNALCGAGKAPLGFALYRLPDASYDFSMHYEDPIGPAFGNILAAKQLSRISNLGAKK